MATTAVALFFQLSPSHFFATVRALDMRNWSHSEWILANFLVLLVLVAVRVSPELVAYVKERREANSEGRPRAP